MLTEFLNFLDKHLGTLAGWDLGIVLLFVAVVYAIYKLTPIAQEWVKQRKVITERRKGMNGDFENVLRKDFEESKDFQDKRFNEERKQNAAEHKALEGKIECLQKDVTSIKTDIADIKGYMRAKKDETNKS